ncbi:MAG TPA: DUF3379 family protein [Gammaproteobacteria bacterium]|nr:DUF3379 family protein [Gammaproteobacteria bacterium]
MSMSCLEFRRICGAEPGCSRDDFAAHRQGCAGCGAFAAEMQALDGLILEALSIEARDLPRDRAEAARPPARPRSRPPAWLGIAASLAAGLAIASVIWLSLPRVSLAHEVVEHVVHEPMSLSGPAIPVEDAELRKALDVAGASLGGEAGLVRYAMVCLFRGKLVPHLVVQGERGPVTVMLLREEKVSAPMPIDEGGFEGTIVPAGEGSIAVLGREPGDIQLVKNRVLEALQWPADPRPQSTP